MDSQEIIIDKHKYLFTRMLNTDLFIGRKKGERRRGRRVEGEGRKGKKNCKPLSTPRR